LQHNASLQVRVIGDDAHHQRESRLETGRRQLGLAGLVDQQAGIGLDQGDRFLGHVDLFAGHPPAS
jgi:hypothetical protein